MANSIEIVTVVNPGSDFSTEMNFDVAELSDKTGYSKRYLRYLLRLGKIKGAKLGKHWLCRVSEVERYKLSIAR